MNVVSTVFECYRKYFANGRVDVLLLLAIAWVLWKGRGRRITTVVQTALVMLAVIVFPISAKVIMLLLGDDVYWRMFWVLPAIMIISFVCTELSQERKGMIGKVITALLCAGVIAVNGTFVFGGNFFTVRENNFKIPTRIIRVTDAINEHYETHNVTKRKVIAPTSIAELLRLYDGSLRLRDGRYTMQHPSAQHKMYKLINSDTPKYKKLRKRCRKWNYDYVVLTSASDDREKMEELEYECIFDDIGYVVYFDTSFYEK